MLQVFKIWKICKSITHQSKVLESSLANECANYNELTFSSFLQILDRMEQREQPLKIVLFSELKKSFLLLANKIQSDIDILSQHVLNLI